jgi:hypothetical protein
MVVLELACALYLSFAGNACLIIHISREKVNFSILNFTLSDFVMKTTLETGLRCIIMMYTNNKPFLMKAKDLSSRCIRAKEFQKRDVMESETTINTFVVWTQKPQINEL